MAQYEVNIDAANVTKQEMAGIMKTENPHILNRAGSFSALYDISDGKWKTPVLVLKTEEPGSKQYIAAQYNHLESVCKDMINHLINDCIVMGATPLSIQDAIICGKLEQSAINRMVRAMKEVCDENGCILTGGETSEQPGILDPDKYILTSSIVGIVERDRIIDGSKICEGDLVLGLQSSGIHTNGYTLVRTIMKEHPEILEERFDRNSFVEEILIPHRCYYNALKELFDPNIIHGMAHITGGGIRENLNRILPSDLDAVIDLRQYEILPIFKLLRKVGNISDEEMLRVFNLGIGMVLVVKPSQEQNIRTHVERHGIPCKIIGHMQKGSQKVRTEGSLQW